MQQYRLILVTAARFLVEETTQWFLCISASIVYMVFLKKMKLVIVSRVCVNSNDE